MSEHTSAPWFIHARLDEQEGTMVLAAVPGKDHFMVADCWDGRDDHAEAVANTRIIAAAPELLASLDELIDSIESGYTPRCNGSILRDARAAVAKARGQS